MSSSSGRFQALHVERSSAFVVALPAGRAFDLFTPEGEKAWAEGWEPEYLHPGDGRLAEGMVFRTGTGGEATLWVVTRCDRAAGEVEYVRATPGSRVAMVTVHCTPLDAARTRVAVRYAFTGLSEAGNEWIRAMDHGRYGAFVDSWRAAIEAMLANQ
jgi:hypothetical protein